MDDAETSRVGPVSERAILDACGERSPPPMGTVEQVWETDPVPADEVAARAAAAVAAFDLEGVPPGGEVAVGAGSRGIAHAPALLRGTVRALAERGYDPFVVPAMGSHGGATAAGQREQLAALGVTEDAVGCEIRATMDVEQVATAPDLDVPVFLDANAAAADAVVPVNRVKPHTSFQGPVESGLSKMLVIGFGKQAGARVAHEQGFAHGMGTVVPALTRALLDAVPVAGGVAVVEDQYDDPALIEGVPPGAFLDREAELLEVAYESLPTLPFDDVDVLVVDRMGKDVSGTGLDPNVIGRLPFPDEEAPEHPDVGRIYVRSLTPASKGNANGLGLVDFVHADVLADVDATKSLVNTLTSSHPSGAAVPPAVETDRAGLVAALSTLGPLEDGAERVVRVTDTMRLGRLYASPPLVEAARQRADLRVVSEPEPVAFEDDGALVAPSPDPVEQE